MKKLCYESPHVEDVKIQLEGSILDGSFKVVAGPPMNTWFGVEVSGTDESGFEDW